MYLFVVPKCDHLDCKYGSDPWFDPQNGCACRCLENFSGFDCSTFNASALPNLVDPIECNEIDCVSAFFLQKYDSR